MQKTEHYFERTKCFGLSETAA